MDVYNRLFSYFGPQYWWPGDTPFEVMVGAILTQNTNWGNVEKAITNLKNSDSLDPEIIHRMRKDRLASLIRPAGYFNIKTARLKSFIAFFMNHYDGTVTRMKRSDAQTVRNELLAVHGIGPETADSILLYALDKPVFVIDAYTKRVLSRHGILPFELSYDEFQSLFHAHLPADRTLFNEYHALFVRVGKEFCKPKPRCEGCPLQAF